MAEIQSFDYNVTGVKKTKEEARAEGKQIDETPAPEPGGLQSFDYQTIPTMESTRARMEREQLEKQPNWMKPGLPPSRPLGMRPISPSEVEDERNITVLSRRYGKKFNEEEAYSNPFLVFDMSRSDEFSEKKEKFLDTFPKGDIKQERIGNKKVTLVRETPQEPWQVYEDTIAADIISGETLGGVAGVAAAPFTGGGSLAMAGLTGLGTAAGSLTEDVIEEARGYQDTPANQMAYDALIAGGTASAIDLATMGVGRLSGLAKRVPRTKGQKQTVTADKVADRMGFKPVLRGQAGELPPFPGPVPLVPQIFRQAGATSSKVGYKFDEQEIRLLERMREMTATDFASASDRNLSQMVETQRKELESLFSRAPEKSTPGKLGGSLQSALERYKEVSGKAKNRLYGQAKKAGGSSIRFNISRAKRAIKEELSGHSRKSVTTGGVETMDPDIRSGLRQSLEDILDTPDVIRSFTHKGQEQSAIDQLVRLRTRLFDYMTDGSPQEQRIAGKVWSELKRSLENPTGGTRKARTLLQRANKANAIREANLQVGAVSKALKEQEPGKLIKYFRPNNENAIKTIKNLSGKQWDDVKAHYLGNLTANPRMGLSKLNQFENDKGTLRQIMSADEEGALREYLKQAQKLDESKLSKLSESQLNRAHRVDQLVEEGRERLAETIRVAGGSDSPFAEDARKGLLRRAADKATVVGEEGEQMLSAKILRTELNNLMKSDKYAPLFTNEFKSDMDDLLVYLSKVKRDTTDIGASMEVAGLAAQAKNMLNPIRAIAGWAGAGVNVLWGNMLSRPSRTAKLLDKGGLVDEKALRYMTQMAKDLDDDSRRYEEEELEEAGTDIYRSKLGEENGE